MPTFAYKARDDIGKSVSGTMSALSEEDLMNKLRKLSYMPVSIRETAQNISQEKSKAKSVFGEGIFQRIKIEDIVVFNMQLASMIDAGITLLGALNIISRQILNERFKNVVSKITQSVSSGSSLSDALSEHPAVFSKLYISMIRAGEMGGSLNVVLNRLAIYMEQQQELRQRIRGALFYPAILLVAGILVVLLIVTFVMPKFIVIFTKADIALPLPTQILYGVGVAIKQFWYLILASVFLVTFGIKAYIRSSQGKFRFDQFILKVPIVGILIRKVIVARFSRTLATLVDSGVSMLQSLDIMKDVVGNEVIGRVVQRTRASVERGERLDQPLKMSGEFPDDAVHMISVGEETGKLGYMLNKVADFYDTSVDYSIKKLTTLIEPFFITLMGIMVGFIMASMLIPIFDMVKTIQT
ncbi:MAG: type II secretion system F family protein [Candidatus Omnitrophica bacterium]|nr:type II secretion system F family protein [Candidatus Omnitrophota bacterium]